MNFNINNQRAKFHLGTPIMRHFSTIGLVANKPDPPDYILKPGCTLKSMFNLGGNIFSSKSFTNPNFVNTQNPSIFSHFDPQKLTANYKNLKIDNFCHENPVQTLPEPLPSKTLKKSASPPPNNPKATNCEASMTNPGKPPKKNRGKHRKGKGPKCGKVNCEPAMGLQNGKPGWCSSPKKFKRTDSRGKSRKKCKPWHKTSLEMEIMDCDPQVATPESPVPNLDIRPPTSFCIQIKSAPIEISAGNNLIAESMSISVSPCVEISQSSFSDSASPSSPAIRRLRLPSECDSEDSYIVFCDDAASCISAESLSSDEMSDSDEYSESEDADDSDINVVDFNEKTDLNKNTARKKVSFKCGPELCKVHPMIKWGFAYHTARMGPWEQFARDRERFENRIRGTETVLDPVLCKEHRDRIFHERFE